MPTLHYNPGGSRKHPVSKFDREDVVDGVRTLIDRKYVQPGQGIGTWPRAKRAYFRQLEALDQNLQAGNVLKIRYEISEPGQQDNLKKKMREWIQEKADWDDAKKVRVNSYIEDSKIVFSFVPAM